MPKHSLSQFAAILIAASALVVLVLFSVLSAHAAGGGLKGWGWSSTIGWVSFSSTNAGVGTGGTYGVNVDGSGHFDGYAWSPNIGWISFHPADLSDCPTGNGSPGNCLPMLNQTTGSVAGWARACAGTVNGNCTGASRTDGWDGWIELSGTNHPSPQPNGSGGVTFVSNGSGGGDFTGYAWGSSVLGWLNFNPSLSGNQIGCVGGSAVCCPTCGGTPTGPSASCAVNPANLPDSRGRYGVIATAVVASGTGPYLYQWSDGTGFAGGFVSGASHSFTFPPGDASYTRIPFVQVKDTATGNTSEPAYCGLVTVSTTGTPTETSALQLKVDSSYGNGQTGSARVRKNRPFKLYSTSDNSSDLKNCVAGNTASPAKAEWNGNSPYHNYSDSAKTDVRQQEPKVTYTINCATADPDFSPSASIDVNAVSPEIQEL